MYALKARQQKMLVEAVNEQFGSQLGYDDFAEATLALFEDIPGFEAIPDDKSAHIVQQLWSQYHG